MHTCTFLRFASIHFVVITSHLTSARKCTTFLNATPGLFTLDPPLRLVGSCDAYFGYENAD